MGDFIAKVLAALDDKRVADKIREITISYLPQRTTAQSVRPSVSANEELRKKYKELENRCFVLEKEKNDITENLYSVKSKNADIEKTLSALLTKSNGLEEENTQLKYDLTKARKKASDIAEKYTDIEKYYEMYCNLSDDIHNTLSRVLSCKSPALFIASGSQRDSIEGLWDTISYRRYSEEELDILGEIFDFFFELYNDFHNMYERLDTRPGDLFDSKLHNRISGGVNGTISYVFLKGYRNIKNGDIIKKSMIII